MQTRRLAASFEPLNSSLLLLAPEFYARKATCDLVVLARKFVKVLRSAVPVVFGSALSLATYLTLTFIKFLTP